MIKSDEDFAIFSEAPLKHSNKHGGRLMRKGIWILVFIVSIIMISCQEQNKDASGILKDTQEQEEPYAVAEKINSNILSAMDELKNGKIAEGADLLLEAVLLTKPREYMPEGFENVISSARDQFQEGNVSKGVELVSDALQMIQPSREEKEELKDMEQIEKKVEPPPIAEIVSQKVSAAHQEFQKGNADKGVVLLLESIRLFGPLPND